MLMFIVLQFLMLIIIAVRTFANGAQLPVEAIPVRAPSLPTVLIVSAMWATRHGGKEINTKRNNDENRQHHEQ
ncbi:hypothetical protein OKW50_005250 [Paraburkholderia youngii]|uniref:hypothetical protein n=1 Tax=Paraburkholderia youngii TaxID=2782701 RepID=UPI003D1F207A